AALGPAVGRTSLHRASTPQQPAFPPVESGPRDAVLLRYLPGLSLTAAKVDDRLFLFFFAQLCRGLVYPSDAKKRSIFDARVEPVAKRVSVRVSEGPNGFLQVAAMSQIVVDSRSFLGFAVL